MTHISWPLPAEQWKLHELAERFRKIDKIRKKMLTQPIPHIVDEEKEDGKAEAAPEEDHVQAQELNQA